MVWMMSLPRGFGEFWPDGDFEEGDKKGAPGWSGRLKAYIKDLPPERQRELMPSGDWFYYGYFVSKKFITEVGSTVQPDLPPNTPVLDHEAPRTFDTVKGYKQLGDLIMLNSRILAVSEGLKTIIEALDPGAHQFFPIAIVQPRSVHPKSFYTLVITHYRDSFTDVKNAMPPLDGGRYIFTSVNKAEAAQCWFKRSEFAGAHLWRERKFTEFIVMLSDELVARAAAAGLRLPKMHQAKEFD